MASATTDTQRPPGPRPTALTAQPTLRSPAVGLVAIFVGVAMGTVLLAGAPSSATAQDEVGLLSEPTRYTDVLDAFDGDDPFDLRLSIGFRTLTETADIQREQSSIAGSGRTQLRHFGKAQRTEKRMWLSAEVGVYRDVMVFVRAPFVLEDALELDVAAASISDALLTGDTQDSRVRDGVPFIDVGIAVGIWNQFRSPGLPTWVLRLDAEVSAGEARAPCLRGQTCFRGAGRGTVAVQAESRFSYRYRVTEPYFGIGLVREWVSTGRDNFSPNGAAPPLAPPTRGAMTLGTAIVAWEDRGRFQRFSIDVRGRAQYVSRGRDYSVLYDVLGASDALDAPAADTPFTGVTAVEAHGRFSLQAAVDVQAARYVQFRLGAELLTTTPHLLTGEQPCGPSGVERTQPCSERLDNARFRALIDRPGRRFRLRNMVGVEMFASAFAQF